MKKKIIALLALTMFLLTFTGVSAQSHTPLATEDFNYPITQDNTTLPDYIAVNGQLEGGTGWSTPWKGDTALNVDPASNVYLQTKTIAGNTSTVIRMYSSTSGQYSVLYRGLTNPIKRTEAGDYYISWHGAYLYGTTHSTPEVMLHIPDGGGVLSSIGMRASTSGGPVYPSTYGAGLSGGTWQRLYGTKVLSRDVFYTHVLKLSVRPQGTTSAHLKVFEAGTEEPAVYDVTIPSLTLPNDITKLGFRSQFGTNSNLDNLIVEKYDPDDPILVAARAAVSTVEAQVTVENFDAAREAVNLLDNGLAKNELNARLANLPGDLGAVLADADALKAKMNIMDKENIVSDITLDLEGMKGSAIEWESTNNAIIDSEGNVTRPTYRDGPAQVTLTALVSKGDAQRYVSFDFVVLTLDKTIADCYIISAPEFYKLEEGETSTLISALEEGVIKYVTDITNADPDMESGTRSAAIIMALYKNNQLQEVKITEFPALEKNAAPSPVEMSVTVDGNPSDYKIALYSWVDMNGLLPIVNAQIFDSQGLR